MTVHARQAVARVAPLRRPGSTRCRPVPMPHAARQSRASGPECCACERAGLHGHTPLVPALMNHDCARPPKSCQHHATMPSRNGVRAALPPRVCLTSCKLPTLSCRDPPEDRHGRRSELQAKVERQSKMRAETDIQQRKFSCLGASPSEQAVVPARQSRHPAKHEEDYSLQPDTQLIAAMGDGCPPCSPNPHAEGTDHRARTAPTATAPSASPGIARARHGQLDDKCGCVLPAGLSWPNRRTTT